MFKIYDGRNEFYQWDVNRKVIVSDPAINELHFCNKTDDCALVTEVYELDGLRVANVPNILLQSAWDIRVYGYCGECYTRQAARFKVVERSKPADYMYTETEIKTFATLEARMDELEHAFSVEGVQESVTKYLEENPVAVDLSDYALKEEVAEVEETAFIAKENSEEAVAVAAEALTVINQANETASEAKETADGIAGIAGSALNIANTALTQAAEANEKIDALDDIAKGAVGGETFEDYQTLIATLNAANAVEYYQGQHMLIKTLEVPDVWVYEVSTEYQPYEYVDDQTFAAALVSELPQVGFYKLSALETQKVDLVDYVKFTDYATASKAGVIKYEGNQYGIYLTADGVIKTEPATEAEILAKVNVYKPITPRRLPYAVKVGITANTETWTDEDKAAACETIGAVAKPTTTSGFNRVYGVQNGATTTMFLDIMAPAQFVSASDAAKRSGIASYTGGRLGCYTPQRDYEATNKKYVDDGFVAKQTPEFDAGATRGYAYVIEQEKNAETGEFEQVQKVKKIQIQASSDTIPLRNPNGNFYVNTPTLQYECANKKYVDDAAITHVWCIRCLTDMATGEKWHNVKFMYKSTVEPDNDNSLYDIVYNAGCNSEGHMAIITSAMDENMDLSAPVLLGLWSEGNGSSFHVLASDGIREMQIDESESDVYSFTTRF